MDEPRHGAIVSGEVIPPQTYLHKVAAAKHEDPADDGPEESTAAAEDTTDDTAAVDRGTTRDDTDAADDSYDTYDADDEGDDDESTADTAAMPAASTDTTAAHTARTGATLEDTQPDVVAADTAQPDTTQPDTAQTDTTRSDTTRTGTTRTGTDPDGADTAVMEPARTDSAATESPTASSRREGRPGDVPIPEDVSLIGDGARVREQWMRVQASFVDDPRAAVTAAAGVITDAIAQVETAVRTRQQALRDRWDGDGDGHADTEALRVVMQQYRQLLERLAAL